MVFAARARTFNFDPVALTDLSTAALGNLRPEPTQLQLRFALAGGGVYISGPSEAYAVNTSVSAAGFGGGGNASPTFAHLWAGWNASPAVAIGGDAPIANTAWPESSNVGNTNAIPQTTFGNERAAVFSALDLIYPVSSMTNWEWGGKICLRESRYFTPRFVTSMDQSRVDTDSLTACPPGSSYLAHYHTHPPKENPNPSGDDYLKADNRPLVTFYLRSPKIDGSATFPPRATHTLRYKGDPEPDPTKKRPAFLNTFEWVNGDWKPYP